MNGEQVEEMALRMARGLERLALITSHWPVFSYSASSPSILYPSYNARDEHLFIWQELLAPRVGLARAPKGGWGSACSLRAVPGPWLQVRNYISRPTSLNMCSGS